MEKLTINNIYNSINHDTKICASVPGSKSITNRALLLSMLSDCKVTLNGVLFSDDSRHFIKCVKDLGVNCVVDEENHVITIEGTSGKIPTVEGSIYVGSAGTAARFLSATLGISQGVYHIDASEQMRKRPMAPLLNSLTELGCEVIYPEDGLEGHFPFTLKSHGISKNHISINIDSSSQFLSALLIASVLSNENFTIDIEGSHGMSYIEMTKKMMSQFGVTCNDISSNSIQIFTNQKYHLEKYDIEPDASAAAYFYAMCPLLNIPAMVKGIHFDSLQGDVEFIKALEKMGCTANDTAEGIVVFPPSSGEYNGINIDMHAFSDQAITLAALAPFANSPTTITGIGHIRLQESDRLSAISTELGKMGIKTEEGDDYITIYPGTPKPSSVCTYDDHRMAMGFSLIGLRSEGIEILDPLCCRKTFENYFDILEEVSSSITN